MDRCAPEKPHEKSAESNHDSVYGHQRPCGSNDEKAAHDQKRRSICDKVREAPMQEWHGDDPIQSADIPWD